jgi:hypothetical protein
MEIKKNWYEISASDFPTLTEGRNEKYGKSNYGKLYMKEREIALGDWNSYFPRLLQENDLDVSQRTLVVGVNDGQETNCISQATLFGMDIAISALEKQTSEFSTKPVQASASALPYQDLSFCNVICLRTYQVLKPKERELFLTEATRICHGRLLISLPGGYFDVDKGEVVSGCLVVNPATGKDEVDLTKPDRDANDLKTRLENQGWTDTKVVKTPIEIFIFSSRNKSTK